jgi:glucose-6-phosphate 1-dehydrogenase
MLPRDRTGWSRMVIEKPFGKDSDSYMQLATAIAAEFSENQMYRIDHYLGKEVQIYLYEEKTY